MLYLVTDAAVRAKLDKIMASDYYTAQPEMPEMGAAVDLSAAVQESMVVSPEAPAVEESQAEGHKVKKIFVLFLPINFTWRGPMIVVLLTLSCCGLMMDLMQYNMLLLLLLVLLYLV